MRLSSRQQYYVRLIDSQPTGQALITRGACAQLTGPPGAHVALDEADLRNVTLDNTGGGAEKLYAYAADQPQNQSAAWAPAPGVDAYFGANATLPDALVPQLSTGGAGHEDALLGCVYLRVLGKP